MLFPDLKQCCRMCRRDRNCWEMGLANWGNVCNVWVHYNKLTERNKHPIASVCFQSCSSWSCWPTDLLSRADFVHLFVGRQLRHRLRVDYRSKVGTAWTSTEHFTTRTTCFYCRLNVMLAWIVRKTVSLLLLWMSLQSSIWKWCKC